MTRARLISTGLALKPRSVSAHVFAARFLTLPPLDVRFRVDLVAVSLTHQPFLVARLAAPLGVVRPLLGFAIPALGVTSGPALHLSVSL
jgi:hypothetical protein